MIFDKLGTSYLIGGALNKTHALFFQDSSRFDQKIHFKIPVVILQQLASDPAATMKIDIVSLAKTIISKHRKIILKTLKTQEKL